MNDRTFASLEQLSALADGQLHGEELRQALDAVGADARLRESWQTYHLVGEVLRTGRAASGSDTSVFMARLSERLAAEVIEPARLPQVLPESAVRHVRAEAANEPVFRWKMVAGLASVAAAAAIGWAWVGTGVGQPPVGGQLALQQQAPAAGASGAVPAPVLAAAPLSQTRVSVGGGAPQVMLRDPRLDELLEAHQQAVGASQMPAGFLRNATFEGAAR
ncbi:sigma-E factor negative regulatory protein [Xenophilus arseniciresistens]|uniref:Sigma-E factor negative regulatory protein n=1 Tax=Xenophilus arseniciresistens TaxID=1283306 RepID=A0AAE3N5Z5_9BURK|nr:sigma-E factor negative regulatory protein [Xenophilus arseniciresistens]MDA7416535.1 sigma-E factor negative regulatory protein [Xenophilus arseniciresistens]